MKSKTNKPKYHYIEQRSDEWFKIRELKMTASHAQAIGSAGKGLYSYVIKMMSEFFSSGETERYKSEDMERGNELEELAVMAYEVENNIEIEKVGFVELEEFVGCSPDGLVGEDGLIEVKSINDNDFYRLYHSETRKIPSTSHIWQCQMQLLVTGRKWVDLVYFNPNYEYNLIVFRIKPEEYYQDKLEEGLEMGKELIKKHLKLNNYDKKRDNEENNEEGEGFIL